MKNVISSNQEMINLQNIQLILKIFPQKTSD